MSWQVVYHYDEQEAAELVFDGVAHAYDRADRLELLNPAGEVMATIYVTHDAAKAAGAVDAEPGVAQIGTGYELEPMSGEG